MSGPEVKRVHGGMTYLRATRRLCGYVVLGDNFLDLPEREARKVTVQLQTRIVVLQGRAGLRPFWLNVRESTGGLHANLIFPASEKILDQIRNSTFGAYLGGKGAQMIGRTAGDWHELTHYLVKERTPQAEFAHGHALGPRRPGSHRLGEGGGDRVTMSRALYEAATAKGYVQPWKRTTSRNLTNRIILPPALVVPPKVEPTVYTKQDDLFTQAPVDTFTSGAELRQLRDFLSLTQEQAALRLHLRNRSTIANAERDHDRLSPQRVRYLRYLAEAERIAA